MISATRPALQPTVEGRNLIDETNSIRSHRAAPSNLAFMRQRELGMLGANRRTLAHRQQYEQIPPNTTLYDVPVQFVFAKRFSPCGKYLVCFGRDLKSIQIYTVKYCQKPSTEARVEDFLQLTGEVQLSERVCRDFCMFFEGNDNMMVIATVTVQSDGGSWDPRDPGEGVRQTTHSLNTSTGLESYTIWLIQYDTGRILDSISYESDHIQLQHHTGVSICGDWLSVTSLQHQVVWVYRLDREKKCFNAVNKVGPYFYSDDPDWDEGMLVGIKQRLLAFLYDRALNAPDRASAVRHFHQSVHHYMALVIWKAQFLDADHLLIKMGPVDQLAKMNETPQAHSLLVWNLSKVTVVNFYQDSEWLQLYDLCRNNNEGFRFLPNSSDDHRHYLSTGGLNFTSTSSNSIYERHLLDRLYELMAATKTCTPYLAKKRLAAAIPYSSQVMAPPASPFFDQNLFIYDDKFVSPIDRVRSQSDQTIKMYSRARGKLLIRLTSDPSDGRATQHRKYNHWIFHPFLPMAVSIQQCGTRSVCNIHYHS